MTKTMTRPQQMADSGLISPSEVAALDSVTARYGMAITPEMTALINPGDATDPIARQFIPTKAELDQNTLDVSDPIGDDAHSPLPGIVHRYPDRLLLLPLRVCPVYCRFCFRRETVGGDAAATLSDAELDTALDYIGTHPEVWEVILSGGDPLILSPRRLHKIVSALQAIKHVKVIRIHTRVPVVDPGRIDAALCESLQGQKPVYVVLHTNHPRELTAAATDACAKLTAAGIQLLSQSVLLKGINDDTAVLESLFRELVARRIKPYYLHHADRAPGTAHFRTTVAHGQQLMRELRGRLSGICLPEYVLDIPGGYGKVPVGPEHIATDAGTITLTDNNGTRHSYPE